jgi:putative glutamine amidotransferase
MACTIAIPKFKKDMLRVYMQSKYTASLRRAGAKAVWIETDDLDKAIEAMLQCDGLLLSGGEDVDPFYYGHTPTEKCGEIAKERDHAELKMLEAFLATGKPVFGICRGVQLMNVHFGGTLHQVIPERPRHRLDPSLRYLIHRAATEEPLLEGMYGKEFAVNSCHHQAIDRLGKGLRITAICPDDGIVEAIAHETLPVFAVQWHPEKLTGSYLRPEASDGAPLFDHFVRLCKERS